VDKGSKTIEAFRNCIISLTGTWVTDTSHQHNEIHDVEAAQVVYCYLSGDTTNPQAATGVVGIARQPAVGLRISSDQRRAELPKAKLALNRSHVRHGSARSLLRLAAAICVLISSRGRSRLLAWHRNPKKRVILA
jgi:hypothetical protein